MRKGQREVVLAWWTLAVVTGNHLDWVCGHLWQMSSVLLSSRLITDRKHSEDSVYKLRVRCFT